MTITKKTAALVLLLVIGLPLVCCYSTVPKQVIQTYSFCDAECQELRTPLKQDEQEEDEVETWYPTQRRTFAFSSPDGNADDTTLTVRQTSFGCGKLGAEVWPSGIALALHLVANAQELVQGRRVLELGAGCGLPSMVCRDVLGADCVLATDFWQLDEEEFDKNRLVPTKYHAMNLQHNIEQQGNNNDIARVQRLDWCNLESARQAKSFGADLIIASDVVYYEMDLQPLFETLKILLRNDGATAGPAPRAILMLPLPPNKREALPEFRKRLPLEFERTHTVDMEEVVLYYKDTGEKSMFLRAQISPKENEEVQAMLEMQ